jgi:amidophosphoribosyltransferase
VLPGEVVRVDRNGVRSWRPLIYPAIDVKASFSIPKSPSLCSFEYVYFARPDSIMEGQMIHSVRTRLGKVLAQEAPAPEADLVSGVPDSSIAAAIGYAKHVNLPFSEVFCKNRYIGRTFIKPDEGLRKNAIQLKYNPLSEILTGKSIVLVDDSLVRGSTLRQLVPLLRKGGALKVHVRISSPPIRHPCYYGVDIGTYDELIATHKNTVEGIRDFIGADSLAFLSHDGMIAAIEEGIPKINESGESSVMGHCSSCMTGNYTIPVQNEI